VTPVTIGVFLLGLLLVVLASCWVAAPLFRASLAGAPVDELSERERWQRQKRQALAAIREVELDHEMGKVSDDDLRAMRARFENQALQAIAALERGRRP
jgi:hypothetical protein